MIGYIWAAMMVLATLFSVLLKNTQELGQAAMNSAVGSASLCMEMLGTYVLFMGMINIAKDSGLLNKTGELLKRPLGMIFPGIKNDDEAMGAVAMNISANMLGMGNAATPFGLAAMSKMQEKNPNKAIPTDDMCVFLVLNNASVQLIPMTVIALRNAMGSANPADIVPGALLSTFITAAFGLVLSRIIIKK